jgi:hypothetical protein
MADLGLVQAFARYGAKLKNPQWSVCALAPNGDLVVSLWEHHRRKGNPGTLEFSDTVNRWSGPGNNEFRAALKDALESGRSLRLVMAQQPRHPVPRDDTGDSRDRHGTLCLAMTVLRAASMRANAPGWLKSGAWPSVREMRSPS